MSFNGQMMCGGIEWMRGLPHISVLNMNALKHIQPYKLNQVYSLGEKPHFGLQSSLSISTMGRESASKQANKQCSVVLVEVVKGFQRYHMFLTLMATGREDLEPFKNLICFVAWLCCT